MNSKTMRLLKYLVDHPGWHYGLDIVNNTEMQRGTVYIHLAALEDFGVVERRQEKSVPNGPMVRPQFRSKLAWSQSNGDAGK